MSIQVPKSFSNSSLPSVQAIGPVIEADPQLVAWYQFDPAQAETDLSGKIASLSPRAGTSAQKLYQTNSTWRPQLAPNKVGGYHAAAMTTSSAMVATASSVVTLNQTFSLAMVFRPRQIPGDTEHAYMCWFNDPGNHILVQNYNGFNDVAVSVAGPEGGAMRNVLPVDGNLHLLVASFTPTATKASGDGVRRADFPVTSGSVATRGSGPLALNSLGGEASGTWTSDFDLADVMLFQKDLFDAANANTLRAVYDYAKYVYGVPVA